MPTPTDLVFNYEIASYLCRIDLMAGCGKVAMVSQTFSIAQ
jgi:hypothetical protein